eukprot:m.21744 g.21744  ORF g.21744 m.21744 type:complete len:363 (+) comp13522_c0_seq1:293-1381(+)
MPPLQVLDYASLGMGDFDTPIAAPGIESPTASLTFDDPIMFTQDLPDDILSCFGWGAITPPLDAPPTDLSGLQDEQYNAKLMQATEFVPGLMWDSEYEPFTPPTTPPASPLHNKCPEAPHPRGFPSPYTKSQKNFPIDDHIFKVELSTTRAVKSTKQRKGANSTTNNAYRPVARSSSNPLIKAPKSAYTAKRHSLDSKAASKRQKTTTSTYITPYTSTMSTSPTTYNKTNKYTYNTTTSSLSSSNKSSALPMSSSSSSSMLSSKLTAMLSNDDLFMENPENKRKTHNVLERKRRNDLKNSYQSLRQQLPDLAENRRAPTGQILTLAVHYISQLQKESNDLGSKLAVIRAENLRLRSQRRMSR